MKLRFITIILALSVASQAITMEKPTWPGNLWQWHKKNKELYYEVKEIVKSGSSVQEIETKKFRDTHQKALEDFKKCVGMSENNWHQFHNAFVEITAHNKLFISDDSTYPNNGPEELTDSLTQLVREKLKHRNIDPAAVKIKFLNTWDSYSGQSWKVIPESQQINVKNKLELSSVASKKSPEYFNYATNHEITHLQENHSIKTRLLEIFSDDKEKLAVCLKPFYYCLENEADGLYALKNYEAAKNAAESRSSYYELMAIPDYKHPIRNDYEHTDLYPFFNWSMYKKLEYFKKRDGERHPSNNTRSEKLKRIFNMLKIENSLLAKQQEKTTPTSYAQKNLRYLFAAFNPSQN